MKPLQLLLKIGLQNVFTECGNNIRSFKAFIFRECPETTQGQWYYIKNLCEKTLQENINTEKAKIIDDLKEVLERSFNDGNRII